MAMAEMDANDDEAERQQLRLLKEEEAKKAVMSSPYKEKKAKGDKGMQSESNLFAKLSTTIGLCTENVPAHLPASCRTDARQIALTLVLRCCVAENQLEQRLQHRGD